MITFNETVFKEMYESKQLNDPTSPLWIIKTDKVFHQGKYYLKVYIHQNESIINELKGITFEINTSEAILKLDCYKFSKVESFFDENIFGCLLEMPDEYRGSEYSVIIRSYFLYNEEKVIDQNKQSQILLTDDQHEVVKSKYLKTLISNFFVFPVITKEYWQCKCGKINSLNSKNCSNCSSDFSEIEQLVNKGLEETFFEKFVSANPFVLDTKVDVETNLSNYVSKFEKYGISRERILTSIETKEFIEKYLEAYPFKLNLKFEAKENIDQYVQQIGKFGVNPIEVESRFNIEELKTQINNKLITTKKLDKKRKTLTIFSVASILFLAFLFLWGIDLAKYGIASIYLSNKRYDAAILEFSELGQFINSKEMLNETYYQKAKSIYKEDPKASIVLLEKLVDFQYKDSYDLFNEYIYSYANQLFTEGDYFYARAYFQKIDESIGYKDSQEQINECNYQLGLASFNKKEYVNASEYFYFGSIKKYKDSSLKYQESVYLQGNFHKNSQQYEAAISYYSKIKEYKDSANLIKECYYLFGKSLLAKKDYSNALLKFNEIKGYKDVSSIISTIENTIYSWKLSNGAVTDYEPRNYPENHQSVVGKYAQYYYYSGFISGGKPYTSVEVRFQFNYPGGTVSDYQTIDATEGQYISHGRGYEGAGAPSGSYSYKVFFKINGSWKLMDTKYFRVY